MAWGIAGAVRDGGRTGLAHLGRGRGGAVDLAALRLGNRLVGNEVDVTGIESSGGLVVRCDSATMIALTGSPADVHVDGGPPLGWGVPVALPAGAIVRIGRLRGGARSYLCVRGGISRIDGNHLEVGPDPMVPAATHPAVPLPLDTPIRLWPGPRLDWFAPDAFEALSVTAWEVLPESNRVGLRLAGVPLHRVRHDELPSEGLLEGAIQVPPDGQPIVMLADHPTTGGYPVIAIVEAADLSLVVQRPPGAPVRFTAAR